MAKEDENNELIEPFSDEELSMMIKKDDVEGLYEWGEEVMRKFNKGKDE